MRVFCCNFNLESGKWALYIAEPNPDKTKFNVVKWDQSLTHVYVHSDQSYDHGQSLIRDEISKKTTMLLEAGDKLKVRIDRLTQLADHLTTVSPELFDLDSWAEKTECGTVCCAFGHAPTIFPELSLQYDDWSDGLVVWWSDRVYGRWDEVSDCIEEFFGIDKNVAIDIFFPYRYNEEYPATLENVIKRIRNFIEKGDTCA